MILYDLEKRGSYLCLSDANPDREDDDSIKFVYNYTLHYFNKVELYWGNVWYVKIIRSNYKIE